MINKDYFLSPTLVLIVFSSPPVPVNILEDFFRKLRRFCTKVGLRCKQKIPFLTLPPSATEECNSYMGLRFVKITALLNLFHAVTPDWEISLSYMSLHPLNRSKNSSRTSWSIILMELIIPLLFSLFPC